MINCCAIMFPVDVILPDTNKEPETPESFRDINPFLDINSLGIFL